MSEVGHDICTINRPVADIDPLGVTVAHVSKINKSKTMECLGYLWLGDIPLKGRPRKFWYSTNL